MNKWTRLSPDEAHKLFRIPPQEARKENNAFYSIPPFPYTDNSFDGPWPLLSFLSILNSDRALTFQIDVVEEMFLADENFNPLEDDAGYLYVDKAELIDLADLLRSKASNFKGNNSHTEPTFMEISGQDLESWGVKDIYSPREHQRFFRQIRSVTGHNKESVTILMCVVDTANPTPYFGIHIYQITLNNELLQSYQYRTFGRLDLDRQGLEELASILMDQISPYDD